MPIISPNTWKLSLNMKNEQKNLNKKATGRQHQIFPNFTDLDQIMNVDEPTLTKRTRNVTNRKQKKETP
jgi:hypothetical protein